ncbi:MAG: hypothetical protein H6605_06785 [Flavobacteriales bacterium]|nr:hypothetical protein [Flavobacteriales bacterium]
MKRPVLLFIGILTVLVFINSCKHSIPDPLGIDDDTTSIDTGRNDTVILNKRPCDPDTVYFAKDILPIFTTYCLGSGCHEGNRPPEGLNLTTFLKAMASGKIKPFNSKGSDVYEVLTETDPKKIMPPSGALSSDKIALIKKWIDQGAQDLWCDDIGKPCDTVNVSYSKTISVILNDNCGPSCHGTNGGVTLSNYNGVKAVVNNGKLWNSINHTTSNQFKMPNSTTKIDPCYIKQIGIWIDAGAPQN